MNPQDYITNRQFLWALRRGIVLDHEHRNYVRYLDDNLFEPMTPEVWQEFEAGLGHELDQNMRALYSSSALVVNVFHYWRRLLDWRRIEDFALLANVLSIPANGLGAPRFEQTFPIADNINTRPPHLDVVFRYDQTLAQDLRAVAVEGKFREAYGHHPHGHHPGLRPFYTQELPALAPAAWQGLDNLFRLAQEITPDDHRFEFVHSAQLIKHVLGLKHAFGSGGFRLLYLWYAVPHPATQQHAAEIAEFAAIAHADGIEVQSMTYQQLIYALSQWRGNPRAHEYGNHRKYLDYLAERYL